MTTSQDRPDYGHRAAVDAEGNRIGKISKVYLDDQTGQPRWVLVETGLFGTRQSFAPIHGSRLDGELVVLAVSKDQVKDAPTSTRTRRSAKASRTPSASTTAAISAPPRGPAVRQQAGRPG